MASCSAPLMPDKVTQSGEISASGEKECATFLRISRVNTYIDRSERTLLAWRWLMVIRRFMLIPYAAVCNHPVVVRCTY